SPATRTSGTTRTFAIPEGNPYRGLHTFEAQHRALFFGRRAEIGQILDRLRVEPLVLVAGDRARASRRSAARACCPRSTTARSAAGASGRSSGWCPADRR